MNRLTVKLLLAIFFVWTEFGCIAVKLDSHYTDPEADFSSLKTYDFYDLSFESFDKRPPRKESAKLLMTAIESELSKRGYKKESNPDIIINIGAVVSEEVQTREANIRTDGMRYMGQRNYSWQANEIEVRRYAVGTVTIDFVDSDKKEVIWQAVVEGTIHKKDEKIEQSIVKAVQLAFDKFPN